jgi:hypothetical protein
MQIHAGHEKERCFGPANLTADPSLINDLKIPVISSIIGISASLNAKIISRDHLLISVANASITSRSHIRILGPSSRQA